MKINHLINGKSVPGTNYFETVNPATQDVLAEVASGGAAEVNAAVQAAKAGDTVRVDCAHVIKVRPIMGDENAEGRGPDLNYSSQELVLNMATLPVSAGGKMSQQRTVHDLRKRAIKELADVMPRFRWQRSLVHMAGARGANDGVDWVLPPDVAGVAASSLAAQMVNTVRAPTYNRHFVVNAGGLTQGGAPLQNGVTGTATGLTVLSLGGGSNSMAPLTV